MSVLITGSAGFIGFHLSKKFLLNGFQVIGLDNLNSYYDPKLKEARLKELEKISTKSNTNFTLVKGNLEDKELLNKVFADYKPENVINLAAQAGVRYSLENPNSYIQSNLVGFANILECCRHNKIKHLVYASSSSVYGGNKKLPFKECDGVDHPVSIYAATKKANELMAHTYSHLYDLPATGLRFFTVYGPWGRPDMALFKFTKAILQGEPIDVFNHGEMIRDFTYIEDIVESLYRIVHKPATPDLNFNSMRPDPSTSWASHRIFNIGNSMPTPLMEYISAIEEKLGIVSEKNFMPIQPGDVPQTSSDTSALEKWINFKPYTPIKVGISKFIDWYREFYKV